NYNFSTASVKLVTYPQIHKHGYDFILLNEFKIKRNKVKNFMDVDNLSNIKVITKKNVLFERLPTTIKFFH
ncbi:MAG: hypothetical protein V1872_01380, partial [bacterium]